MAVKKFVFNLSHSHSKNEKMINSEPFSNTEEEFFDKLNDDEDSLNKNLEMETHKQKAWVDKRISCENTISSPSSPRLLSANELGMAQLLLKTMNEQNRADHIVPVNEELVLDSVRKTMQSQDLTWNENDLKKSWGRVVALSQESKSSGVALSVKEDNPIKKYLNLWKLNAKNLGQYLRMNLMSSPSEQWKGEILTTSKANFKNFIADYMPKSNAALILEQKQKIKGIRNTRRARLGLYGLSILCLMAVAHHLSISLLFGFLPLSFGPLMIIVYKELGKYLEKSKLQLSCLLNKEEDPKLYEDVITRKLGYFTSSHGLHNYFCLNIKDGNYKIKNYLEQNILESVQTAPNAFNVLLDVIEEGADAFVIDLIKKWLSNGREKIRWSDMVALWGLDKNLSSGSLSQKGQRLFAEFAHHDELKLKPLRMVHNNSDGVSLKSIGQ